MSINPASTNYAPFQGSYQNNQTAMFQAPSEGSRAIPVTITWTDYPTNLIAGIRFNCQPQGPGIGLSQIGTLYVDNTQCAHNLVAYFPDSGHQIEINAFSAGFFPVISNSTTFILAAAQSQPPGISAFVIGEQTLLQILNVFTPPSLLDSSPINVDVTAAIPIQTTAQPDNYVPSNLTNIATGTGTAQLLNAGRKIQITGYDIAYLGVIAGTGSNNQLFAQLEMDVNTIIANTGVILAANQALNPGSPMINKTGINITCATGVVKLVQTVAVGSFVANSGYINVNFTYH